MDKKVLQTIERYIDKFGEALPIDFELRLEDANDPNEWIHTINKAIDDDTPFEPEGIFEE